MQRHNKEKFMKRTALTILTVLSIALVPAAVFGSGIASAACPAVTSASTPKDQVLNSVGEAGGNCSEDQVTNSISAAVTILSYVAGVVAIIMIILSGFRYTTSGGDSGKIASAKNTLIYALVGIVIAVLAQFLVRFVITQANSPASGSTPATSTTPKSPSTTKKTPTTSKTKSTTQGTTGGTSAP
jgi:hypothetical protein